MRSGESRLVAVPQHLTLPPRDLFDEEIHVSTSDLKLPEVKIRSVLTIPGSPGTQQGPNTELGLKSG